LTKREKHVGEKRKLLCMLNWLILPFPEDLMRDKRSGIVERKCLVKSGFQA
jgi:hypothetical protein